MLQCTSCGREQERGKFCGSCGSPLEEMNEHEETETNPTSEQGVEEEQEQKLDEVEEVESKEESEIEQIDSEASKEIETPVEADRSAHVAEEQVIRDQQEAATTAQQPVNQQQSNVDIQENLKSYWQYSVQLLKNPSKAFTQTEDKFVYSLVNLGLYALLFSLVIISYVRSADVYNITGEMDGAGAFFVQMILYLFIILSISLGVVLVSILAMEKMFIKRMTFKQIVIQYSGLLVPLIFVEAIILLFTFIGTSFFVLLIMSAVLFYGLFFLTGIFMYEKVMFYQSSENKVYIAIGTTILVFVALTIMSIIVGETLINKVFENLFYYI